MGRQEQKSRYQLYAMLQQQHGGGREGGSFYQTPRKLDKNGRVCLHLHRPIDVNGQKRSQAQLHGLDF